MSRPLRIDLVMPYLRIGPWDPMTALLGVSLGDVVRPLQRDPPRIVRTESGAAAELFPLALPDGEGLSIRLAQWGEFGFGNQAGDLQLRVPGLLIQSLERWPEESYRQRPALRPEDPAVAECVLVLRPGATWSMSLLGLGRIELRVPVD